MNILSSHEGKLTRIGVFYDGNYFSHVSNYYMYYHLRKARISIPGLHQFLIAEVSKAEDSIARHCRIVDAHYFRGRLNASEAKSRDALYRERVFDEVLMREGIITHYLPLSGDGEKGIDVWLALEAFELAIYKRFDVSVLIAGDGDYLPLIRKLNTLGTRVMVLGWDFTYTDNNGNTKTTRTAQTVLDEATYPILMSTVIDDRSRKSDPIIENLFFVPKTQKKGINQDNILPSDGNTKVGVICNLKEGYGFIKPDKGNENLFFHYTSMLNDDFNELSDGDRVEYEDSVNDKGPCAIKVRKVG
ncbi:MAG: NYN domain-containing protein [Deltaproteobacteria bacterium]|nr:NYN domain-containing protein [Deltaproteobacteria bacterium]